VDPLLLARVHAGLTRPEPDGGYVFTHDNVRETVLAELVKCLNAGSTWGWGRRSK
jgi:hypothetical protein